MKSYLVKHVHPGMVLQKYPDNVGMTVFTGNQQGRPAILHKINNKQLMITWVANCKCPKDKILCLPGVVEYISYKHLRSKLNHKKKNRNGIDLLRGPSRLTDHVLP